MISNNYNLRDSGALGVRVPSRSSGKLFSQPDSQYRSPDLDETPILVKSHQTRSRTRAKGTLSTWRVPNVWSVISLAGRNGFCPLSESVSTRSDQIGLTAYRSTSVTKVLA